MLWTAHIDASRVTKIAVCHELLKLENSILESGPLSAALDLEIDGEKAPIDEEAALDLKTNGEGEWVRPP